MVLILKCIYCESDTLHYLKLKNGSYYPEIIHKDTCPLLKRHISGENGGTHPETITSFSTTKLSTHNHKIGKIIRGNDKRDVYDVQN